MNIDSRGPRFGAAITTVVLAVVLITGSVWLLARSDAGIRHRSAGGLRYAPYGLVYRRLVRPRLGPPSKTEPEAPPRFSQGVGMVFAGDRRVGFAAGAAACSGSSSPRSPWPPRSSTRPSITASVARCTCSSRESRVRPAARDGPHKEVSHT